MLERSSAQCGAARRSSTRCRTIGPPDVGLLRNSTWCRAVVPHGAGLRQSSTWRRTIVPPGGTLVCLARSAHRAGCSIAGPTNCWALDGSMCQNETPSRLSSAQCRTIVPPGADLRRRAIPCRCPAVGCVSNRTVRQPKHRTAPDEAGSCTPRGCSIAQRSNCSTGRASNGPE